MNCPRGYSASSTPRTTLRCAVLEDAGSIPLSLRSIISVNTAIMRL